MANPVFGSFLVRILQYGPFSWKWFNPCIFAFERSRQIQQLQPKQPKKKRKQQQNNNNNKTNPVNIVILHIETTRRS
mgnify:FL=1